MVAAFNLGRLGAPAFVCEVRPFPRGAFTLYRRLSSITWNCPSIKGPSSLPEENGPSSVFVLFHGLSSVEHDPRNTSPQKSTLSSHVLPPMPDSGHALRWERLVATLDSLLDSEPAMRDGTSSMQRQEQYSSHT